MSEVKIIDDTKEIILRNSPVEEKLHVVAVVSNPCNFKIRYKLTNEFMKRMEKEPNVILYVVELAYNNQEFEVTSADNKRHLQVRGKIPLWHKENMINLGVRHLLPKDWKAFAWIDADIAFDNVHWAEDTLKLLNTGGKDFLQLFTHCIDMDFDKKMMNTFTSFGYQYSQNFKKGVGMNYWHPGFAWACNRAAYDKLGGIFEAGILGSGDNIMCHCFINKAPDSLKKGMSQEYQDYVKDYQDKVQGLTLGYVSGPIRHYFHGKKENRNYYGREDILIKYQYDPFADITTDEVGLIIPTKTFSLSFQRDILTYFKGRNEDEMVLEEVMTKNADDKDVLEFKINFILHEFEKLKKKHEEAEKANEKFEIPKFVMDPTKSADDVISELLNIKKQAPPAAKTDFNPEPKPQPKPAPASAPVPEPKVEIPKSKRSPSTFYPEDFEKTVQQQPFYQVPKQQPIVHPQYIQHQETIKQQAQIQQQALIRQQAFAHQQTLIKQQQQQHRENAEKQALALQEQQLQAQQAFAQQQALLQKQQQEFIQQQLLLQQQQQQQQQFANPNFIPPQYLYPQYQQQPQQPQAFYNIAQPQNNQKVPQNQYLLKRF
jgi:hypothetical protein